MLTECFFYNPACALLAFYLSIAFHREMHPCGVKNFTAATAATTTAAAAAAAISLRIYIYHTSTRQNDTIGSGSIKEFAETNDVFIVFPENWVLRGEKRCHFRFTQ